jgi:3-hydroxymyristoyl/3-hydroxydecanoyl-(acyl carrier protein) dehydratase
MSPAAAPTMPGLVDIDATFLPVGHMRQISRVTQLNGAEIVAELDLDSHWVFPEHFPGDPIFPGSLLIESAGQLVALWAWQAGLHGPPRLVRTSAEFHRPVTPAAPAITLRASVRRKRHLHFGTVEIHALDQHVATVEVVLAVLVG